MELVEKLRNLEKVRHSSNFRARADSMWYCAYCQKEHLMYRVWSYETVIAQRCMECKHTWLNMTIYSATTSSHQSIVARAWETPSLTDEKVTLREMGERGSVSLTRGPHYPDKDYWADVTVSLSLFEFLYSGFDSQHMTGESKVWGRPYSWVSVRGKKSGRKRVGSKESFLDFMEAEGEERKLAEVMWDSALSAYQNIKKEQN